MSELPNPDPASQMAMPWAAQTAPTGSAQSSDAAGPESFERAMDELESLVHSMESGDLSLEQSLAAYRRGAGLVTWCRQTLGAVQQQVRILEGDLLKPLDVSGADS